MIESFDLDPFGHRRLYLHDDGRRSFDCSTLLSTSPQFSLAKLSLFLSAPALLGEFLPECPWQNITRVKPEINWPEKATDPSELMPRFLESVKQCVGDASAVAVSFSGGLDSTAVLLNVASFCRERSLKLFAITTNLQSDDGEFAFQFAADLIRNLRIEAELHVVEPHVNGKQEIAWSCIGPRLDAMPEVNYQKAELAQKLGADVVLNGSGADELLGSVKYLLMPLIAAGHYARVADFLRFTIKEGWEALAMELLGVVSTLLPNTVRAKLYWAVNWPELTDSRPGGFLAEPYRTFVNDWTGDWLRNRMRSHVALRSSWALADAWDALFPHDVHLPSGRAAEFSPFLIPTFAEYAMGVPLVYRYDKRFSSEYHCRKALVMNLIPQQAHQHLPQTKMIFSKAFQRYHSSFECSFKRCLELGLFEPACVDLNEIDPTVLHGARSIEAWIRGAEKFGARAVGL